VNVRINSSSSAINQHQAVHSPLTGGGDVELLEEISAADIGALYSDSFGVDVSDEFLGVEAFGFYQCLKSGLRFFYPGITGSESFYEALQRQSWYYLEAKPEYEFARRFISERDVVLEVGCGRGEFARKIVAKSYLGLEYSSKAQKTAAADGIRVVIQSVEIHCVEYKQYYDVVCAFQVLEHVANPTAFIDACIRCLKPGGLLIYSVPNADSYLAYSTNSALNMPPHHVTWWVESTFRYVASLFGMDIHEMDREHLADFHVGQYAAVLVRETLLRFPRTKKQRTLINRSLYFKIVNKLAVLLSQPLAKVLLEYVYLRPIGHSITVVLRKPLCS
jgi:SAM-dependent methyltransferase